MRCSLITSRTILFVLILELFSAAGLTAQAGGGSTAAPNVSLPGPQNPFLGSAPEGKVTTDVLQIDFKDAIDRGLRNNLGLLLASDQTEVARGERWKELSELLPNLSARIQEDVQTQSLAALGFNKLFPLLAAPGNTSTSLPRLVPAFNYFDARAFLGQSVFNFKSLERERSASESVKAAQFSYKDAREMVVLAVGNAYLQAIAAGARVETTEAQVKSAQALYDKATDQQKAGLSPAIDALRSQVELQTRQQQLIVARNDLAKLKLNVARIIGLPPGQEFVLTEKAPYQALAALPLDTYLQRAYASRAGLSGGASASAGSGTVAEGGCRRALSHRRRGGESRRHRRQSRAIERHLAGERRRQYSDLCRQPRSRRRARGRRAIEAGALSTRRSPRAASITKFAPPCSI